jgi:hypothetical protein
MRLLLFLLCFGLAAQAQDCDSLRLARDLHRERHALGMRILFLGGPLTLGLLVGGAIVSQRTGNAAYSVAGLSLNVAAYITGMTIAWRANSKAREFNHLYYRCMESRSGGFPEDADPGSSP